ncbi:CpsD/CapB family tyrosine-protein kinase [Clostridium sardiniense]|uniref:non-specific protein-tyrosine kinase n=1 Tax=Clostridium sardiniense TaxID=29369 RepID=A0ABS7KT10_CLOSR|nr:CpsD/CapB family tyrosine-protein kinase [Clostridium sardiniense]MBY0753926.1 CpsD/CapB family tyrosine-protein kinase [Clostridium sardiniense]MDQ0459559.1 capsular exopolysaccharide synthesis family protein [Clostridium sardiniense]
MFIVEKKPKSIPAESYRVLRTNIQYSSIDKKIKRMLVTSSEPGEGKSTTTGNLALTFSQDEKRVLLIDCDLRKPSIHKKFRVSNNIGLSDVILDNSKLDKALIKRNDYLDILPAGKVPPNPSELLGSKALENLLDELGKKYDVIILDTPPVHAVTDAQILSTKVDGVILVVRAERTKKESVISAKAALDKVNANILGTVLNGGESSKGKYYYYYGN